MRVVIMMFIATLIGCSSISGKKPVSWDAFAGYTDESEMKFCSNLDVLDKSQCVTDLKAYKKAKEACKENASCMFLNEQNWKSFVQEMQRSFSKYPSPNYPVMCPDSNKIITTNGSCDN